MFRINRCNQAGNQQLQMGIDHVWNYPGNRIHSFIPDFQRWSFGRIRIGDKLVLKA